MAFDKKVEIYNPKFLINQTFGTYTQRFVQPEHFSDLQLDTNIFNLQIHILETNTAQSS